MIYRLFHKVGQMKAQDTQTIVLIFVLITAIEIANVSGIASCNPVVLKSYGWCEQWACTDNCTCMERPDCRQYCDGYVCRDMRCLSPSICKQKVHLNGRIRPHVLNMFARAPFVTQDCSGGMCDVMRAKGPKRSRGARKHRRRNGRRKNKRKVSDGVTGAEVESNAALQNCVEGRCKRLISTLKISKQFCSHCTKIHCFGVHAKNCTQICAIGKCNNVQCDAEDCQQACLQNSTCTLKCGKNVKTCLQVCEEGSTCELKCEAKSCRQVCGESKGCRVIKGTSSITTTTVFPTTSSSNTSTNAHEYTPKMYSDLPYEQNTYTRHANTSEPMTITTTTQLLATSFKKTLSSTLLKTNILNIKTVYVHNKNSSRDKESLNMSSHNSAIPLNSNHLQVLAVLLVCLFGSLLI